MAAGIRTSLLAFLVVTFYSLKVNATVYEAETAYLYHAVTETKNAGYVGDSYVNFDNEIGSYIEFSISAAEAGDQTFSFRHANGGATARPMSISLNGTSVSQSLLFIKTGAFTNWTTENIVLNLVKGINTVRLISNVSDGGPNIDNVDVTGIASQLYTVITSVSGPGQVIVSPAGSSFYEGQLISVSAVPALLGKFAGWSGDLSGTDSTVEIAVTGNLNITASFTEILVELNEPDFTMTGYATVSEEGYSTTTGGFGGTTTIVTTLQELIDYAASRENVTAPGILYIRGKIVSPTSMVVTIKHGANISILGEGAFGELENVGLNIRDYKNVIIRNLKVHEVFYPNDAITIDECQHVWVDHNELYSKIGPGIGVDTYDGLLDIKNGSRYVTASWNKIHDHMKTSLIGHTDNAAQQAIDVQFRITYHHNYFYNTDGRNPSLRWGAIHMYNNYFENISDYGIAIRQGAHAKLDNNHYHSVIIPITTNKFDGEGFVCESGTVYSGTCAATDNSITQTDCAFWNDLPYTFTLEPANTVALMVNEYAGVGKIEVPIAPGINESKYDEVSLYPNPAHDHLYLQLAEPAIVHLYDASGRIIRKTMNHENFIDMDISDLENGLYLLEIRNTKGNLVRKFIKK